MIRLFLDGCRVLGALALIALTLSAVIALTSLLLNRASRRKP